jgi:hypothetical protein
MIHDVSNRALGTAARRAGRAVLVVVALLFVAGLAWLWIASSERPSGRTLAPGPEDPEAARAAADRPAELVPAAPPRADAQPVEPGDELEPFASARTDTPHPTGKLGSVRGHVEVSGEEPFPRRWRLILRPSTTLPAREHALTKELEFTDGRQDFEVLELPLGGYDVLADASGFNGQALPVLLEPGNSNPFVNLRMVPAGVLEGRVLDAAGLPAEGVPITLFATADQAQREALSDANGIFRFPKLPDGGYDLLVGRPTSPLLPERRPLRFMAPRLTYPDIELPLLGEIHVPLERPLEGIDVRGSGTNGGLVEGKTDFDGRLVLKHLPAGHFRLRLSHSNMDGKYARRIAVDVVAGQVAEAPVRYGP